MCQEGHRFSHDKLVKFKIEMLLAKLAAFVIELSSCLETNLLQVIFLILLCFHTYFKYLAFILVKRLLRYSTIVNI